MKKILLAMVLVLAMAIPAMAQSTAMNIGVYRDVPIYQWVCPTSLHNGKCEYCTIELFGVCISLDWEARELVHKEVGVEEEDIATANVGETFKVKGTIFSPLPRNTKYQLLVNLRGETIYHTVRVPVVGLNGVMEIQFDDFTFDMPGYHLFTLKAIRPNGVYTTVSTRVFVPVP